MDSLDPANPAVTVDPAAPEPRVWKFWGTALWGFVVFAAMFVGQIAVVVFFVLRGGGAGDLGEAIRVVASSGLAISLSVIAGLPAVVLALWLAIHWIGASFADYLALRWTSWSNFAIGVIGLVVLVEGWDFLSRATSHEVTPDFMVDVLKSAEGEGALWLLVLAFCVAAPITEEFFARGFLYRGWSESALKPAGAILLSSAAWTALHLQYDWYFFGEIFTIGVWLGFLRHRFHSTWATIIVHGLNNFAAVLQTMWLAGQS
jgi:membrane protease YdiL (CAAX protease family)